MIRSTKKIFYQILILGYKNLNSHSFLTGKIFKNMFTVLHRNMANLAWY